MKDQKGITLIALVITIIVLLILAGVSIAMLTGDNGILTKAGTASQKSIAGEVEEAIKLGVADIVANQKDPTYNTTEGQNVINKTTLEAAIKRNNSNIDTAEGAKIKITITGESTPWTVSTTISGVVYEWTVTSGGVINQTKPTT